MAYERMQWPRNAWYVALYSRDLDAARLERRRVLDTPIVFFRTTAGTVAALRDRCPHRAVPLSMGRLCEDDQLMCAYHGLRFDAEGRCTHNPHGTGARPAALRVETFPSVERYGMVWVWMGEAPADPALLPDLPQFSDDRYVVTNPAAIQMNASADLIIDNLLDLSHASFLHDGLLGNAAMVDRSTPEVVAGKDSVSVLRSFADATPPPFFDVIFKGDGQPATLWNNAHWMAPSAVVIDNGAHADDDPPGDGAHSIALHALTPETGSTTHYHICSALRLLPERMPVIGEVLARLGEMRQVAFTQQDDPIVQAQFTAMSEAEEGFRPALLSIDAGPVRWRRVMAALKEHDDGATWPASDG